MFLFQKIHNYHATKNKITFFLERDWKFIISFLENYLINLSLQPLEGKTIEQSFMISKNNFKGQHFNLKKNSKDFLIQNKKIKIKVKQNPLSLIIYRRVINKWNKILEDRPTGAWFWNEKSKTSSHYQLRNKNEKFYGLGEKSGSIDRSFRRFSLSQKDSLGYNAEKSDPLYKSFPWLYLINIKDREKDVGLLYDQLTPGSIDLGSEHSNYHKEYRYYETINKGIDLYIIFKNQNQSILSMLNELVGSRYMPPKWSLGFQFSSMEIADHPKSKKLYFDFLQQCKKNNIPISALHFSSGYTIHNQKRYVFVWDKKRFPNPKIFLKKLKQKGIHLVANLKPVLLIDHPFYKEAKKNNIFVNDKLGNPIVVQFWGGKGSLIDFTKEKSCKWWKQNIKNFILSNGFDAVWNDNNEYDLENTEAYSTIDEKKLKTDNFKSAQALLMSKSSFDITKKFYPNKRTYGVTRSGCLGFQRWAETWTGDNSSSWHTLKWNLSMGLGLSLSGIGLFGHDIGGFTGKKTEKELLIRWFQLMLFHPRFHMNSWKPKKKKIINKKNNLLYSLKSTNFPWMYKDTISTISCLVNLRYELLPIIYAAIWRFYEYGEPIIRPLFLDFDEKEHFDQEEVFSINERIIVAPVVQENNYKKKIFVPFCKEGWFDYYSMDYINKGGWVNLDAPIDKIPILVRGGTVIPKLKTPFYPNPHLAPIKELVIYPSKTNVIHTQINLPIIFDDGATIKYKNKNYLILYPRISINKKTITLDFIKKGMRSMQKEKIYLKLANKWKVIFKNIEGNFYH